MIQPIVAEAAISRAIKLNSGLNPGASLNAFFAIWAGQPVCFAIQPTQMKAAQVVRVITENQSTALIAPRFMVGKPNAARIASGGNRGSKVLSSKCGLNIASTINPAKKVIGNTI